MEGKPLERGLRGSKQPTTPSVSHGPLERETTVKTASSLWPNTQLFNQVNPSQQELLDFSCCWRTAEHSAEQVSPLCNLSGSGQRWALVCSCPSSGSHPPDNVGVICDLCSRPAGHRSLPSLPHQCWELSGLPAFSAACVSQPHH